MNERIETLAKAAGYDMINKAAMRALGFDVEKFAELIVRECIDVLDGKIYRASDHEGDETWIDLILKEHFGVEE